MLDCYYVSGHHQQQQQSAMAAASTPFSLFLPLPNEALHQQCPDEEDDRSSSVVTASPPSSSSTGSVDCTLSLGTPSSRRASAAEHSSVPDLTTVTSKHPSSVSAADRPHQSSCYYRCRQQGGAANKGVAAAFADRRCANCGTSSTPLWRNGPRGPKSLCNACGIRFKKEERRAAATAAMESGAGGCGYSAQQYEYAKAAASPGDGAWDAHANAPFLAWRVNVGAPAPAPALAAVWPERTSLFKYN